MIRKKWYCLEITLKISRNLHKHLLELIGEFIKTTEYEREDGSEKGGSGVNFPLHLGETPTHSTEKQSEQPKAAQRL